MISKLSSTTQNNNLAFGSIWVKLLKSKPQGSTVAVYNELEQIVKPFHYEAINQKSNPNSTILEIGKVTKWNKNVPVGKRFIPLKMNNTKDKAVLKLLEQAGYEAWG